MFRYLEMELTVVEEHQLMKGKEIGASKKMEGVNERGKLHVS
jgi:hypothetical protein